MATGITTDTIITHSASADGFGASADGFGVEVLLVSDTSYMEIALWPPQRSPELQYMLHAPSDFAKFKVLVKMQRLLFPSTPKYLYCLHEI